MAVKYSIYEISGSIAIKPLGGRVSLHPSYDIRIGAASATDEFTLFIKESSFFTGLYSEFGSDELETPFSSSNELLETLGLIMFGVSSAASSNQNTISIGNSTDSLLGVSSAFTGEWEDVTNFTTVGVSIAGSNVTDGILYIETSNDGGITVETSVPYSIPNASFDLPKLWNVIEQFIRVRYVNGTTSQTGHFIIATKYSNGQSMNILHVMGDVIDERATGTLTKSVVTGQDPNSDFFNVGVSGVDNNNSTDAPLGIGEIFTGVWSETGRYAGLTFSGDGKAASPADGVLHLEFSHDGINIVRSLILPVDDVDFMSPRTLGVITNYFRVRYVNGSVAQTSFTFRTMLHTTQVQLISRLDQSLQGAEDVNNVRAVITGVDPDDNFKNVVTTRNGNLATSVTDADTGFTAIVTAGGGLKIAEQTHLVGAPFGGAVLSTDKWDVTITGSGSQDASLPGELDMSTGTTADSTSLIQSIDVARFIPANYNTTHHAVTIIDGASYEVDNIRKWGAVDFVTGNGVYFELDSGSWYVTHCINNVHTRIDQSSWTGAGKAAFPTNSVTANVYEIEYNAGSIVWRVNNNVIHRATLLETPYANDIHFPAGMSNENINGNTTDVSLKLRAAAIYTLGKGRGAERPNFISGTTAGQLIKTGAGHLGRIVLARSGGGGGSATVSIYDGLSAVNQVGKIDISKDDTIPIEYDFTFNIGLFIVITGAGTLGTTITFD